LRVTYLKQNWNRILLRFINLPSYPVQKN